MTPKQEKLIKIIIENYRDKKSTKTLGKMLKEAGYSDATATETQRILSSNTIQEKLSPFVKKLEKERQRIINNISKRKLNKVEYKKLVDSIDVLTKNVQLLSGKETEKSGLTIKVIDYQNGADNSP